MNTGKPNWFPSNRVTTEWAFSFVNNLWIGFTLYSLYKLQRHIHISTALNPIHLYCSGSYISGYTATCIFGNLEVLRALARARCSNISTVKWTIFHKAEAFRDEESNLTSEKRLSKCHITFKKCLFSGLLRWLSPQF